MKTVTAAIAIMAVFVLLIVMVKSVGASCMVAVVWLSVASGS